MKGGDCFSELPSAAISTDIEIASYLKAGLRIPLGKVRGKAKGMRYKQLIYSETEVYEFSDMRLKTGLTKECISYLQGEKASGQDLNNVFLVHSILSAVVKEQVCISAEVDVGVETVLL